MHVHIVTTGGTIASRVEASTGAARAVMPAAELVAQLPQLSETAEVRVTEFSLASSWNITPAMMGELARTIRALQADPQTAGVVVTHGTDTMEESAFAVDLLTDGATPVVFTGAMRNASLPGPDGPRNLLCAVRVAADPAARGVGTLVVMNDEIHAARHVAKTHSSALSAFSSPGTGALGTVDARGVWLRWRPRRAAVLPIAVPEPRVHLFHAAAGSDSLPLQAALAGGARGVVIAGTGSGNVYEGWDRAIRELLDAGVPVVLVTRCGAGRVTPTYGGPGGGRGLWDAGVVPGGDLGGPKARIALMFALGARFDLPRLRDCFADLAG
jgi:L-asparaginase